MDPVTLIVTALALGAAAGLRTSGLRCLLRIEVFDNRPLLCYQAGFTLIERLTIRKLSG